MCPECSAKFIPCMKQQGYSNGIIKGANLWWKGELKRVLSVSHSAQPFYCVLLEYPSEISTTGRIGGIRNGINGPLISFGMITPVLHGSPLIKKDFKYHWHLMSSCLWECVIVHHNTSIQLAGVQMHKTVSFFFFSCWQEFETRTLGASVFYETILFLLL